MPEHPDAVLVLLLGQALTLQQSLQAFCIYNRQKTSVRISDWLDLGHPLPLRMWERRLRGYRAMDYERQA
jgi:hypothetical protein